MRLPDAIIVGAPRSGTTTLYAALRDHPEVFAAHGKELRFFDRNWERGVAWYGAHFEGAKPGQIAVEATPMYLWNPIAMSRISSLCPGVALVAILRDPVQRMHSHFYYRSARGLDTGTIEDAVNREVAGEAGAFPYLAIGQYHRQLVYADSLGFERSPCVLWYDDLSDEPSGLANHLAEFIGISPAPLELGSRRVNAADEFRSVRLRQAATRLPGKARAAIARINRREVTYPPLAEGTRRSVQEFLESDVTKLAELTGRDLGRWFA